VRWLNWGCPFSPSLAIATIVKNYQDKYLSFHFLKSFSFPLVLIRAFQVLFLLINRGKKGVLLMQFLFEPQQTGKIMTLGGSDGDIKTTFLCGHFNHSAAVIS